MAGTSRLVGNLVLETIALRALAVVLAPALFASVFTFAIVALPILGIERAFGRS